MHVPVNELLLQKYGCGKNIAAVVTIEACDQHLLTNKIQEFNSAVSQSVINNTLCNACIEIVRVDVKVDDMSCGQSQTGGMK